MTKLWMYLLFIVVLFSILTILFPQNTKAEIATTTDWIGLFVSGNNGNTTTSTANGNSWVYTSSCTQTAGNTPALERKLPAVTCQIPTTNISPGLYELRFFANGHGIYQPGITPKPGRDDALIDSKMLSVGLTINSNTAPTNPSSCSVSGGKMNVSLKWPVLTAGDVTSLLVTRSNTGQDGFKVFNFTPYNNKSDFTDSVTAPTSAAATYTYTYYLTASNDLGSAASSNEAVINVTSNSCSFTFSSHNNSAPIPPIPTAAPLAPASCPTTNTGSRIQVEDGFLSSTGTGSNFLIPTTTPGKLSSPCIMGNPATIPQFSLLSYDEIKSLYFEQSKTTVTTISDPADDSTCTTQRCVLSPGDKVYDGAHRIFNLADTRQYHIRGNLTINNEFQGDIDDYTKSGSGGNAKTGVFFIDGNLLIKTTNGKLSYTPNPDTGGLVFIVGGGIYIDENMGGNKTLNKPTEAFFISFGGFCSASTGPVADYTAANATCTDSGDTNKPLQINGSIINLGSSSPEFVRSNGLNTDPAEEIIFQPKYLVILKDIFARNLSIWNEIQ